MILQQVERKPQQQKVLDKAGLSHYEQIIRCLPNKYFDCREIQSVSEAHAEQYISFIGTLKSIRSDAASSGLKRTMAKLIDNSSKEIICVTWFGTDYPFKQYGSLQGAEMFVHGKLCYDARYGYQIIAPVYFTPDLREKQKLNPSYKKRKGISEEQYLSLVEKSIVCFLKEPFSVSFRAIHQIPFAAQSGRMIHFPESPEDIRQGAKQFILEELVFFAIHMLKRMRNLTASPPFMVKKCMMETVISKLPYTLTEGQDRTVGQLAEILLKGVSINALVQGDVACGKTIVAFLLLILAAENGYQGALLAPTIVLASQHYEDIKKLTESFGLKIGFLNGTLRKKEKDILLKQVASGEIHILVGTHAITGDDVIYKNLGMIIIDEEQRFGVEKREKLKGKAGICAPCISMTATPIPRTLANAVYGEGVRQYSIESMPRGRQPVDTICTGSFQVPDILKHELSAGRQAYVICPLVEEGEAGTCLSVTETVRYYRKELGQDHQVEALTGKMKEEEMLNVLDRFRKGEIQVLVSTTVVEVGVSHKNASVIIIQNAERFGLSSLHQLRGRVKRGSYKPYCILMSDKLDGNQRLEAMCSTENGFELSKLDLEQRKSGNILGLEQSGLNRHIEMIKQYPDIYEYAKLLAAELEDRGEEDTFLEVIDEIYRNI